MNTKDRFSIDLRDDLSHTSVKVFLETLLVIWNRSKHSIHFKKYSCKSSFKKLMHGLTCHGNWRIVLLGVFSRAEGLRADLINFSGRRWYEMSVISYYDWMGIDNFFTLSPPPIDNFFTTPSLLFWFYFSMLSTTGRSSIDRHVCYCVCDITSLWQ